MTNDVLIIGGGIIGLACGVELKLRGANVTVICRDFTAAASHAAAGMLAPDAENITNEAMLSLCRRSRNLYLDWTEKLTKLTAKKDLNNTGWVDTKQPWFYRNNKILDWQIEAANIYFKKYGHMVWFDEILKDAQKLKSENTDSLDSFMACLYGFGTGDLFGKAPKKIIVDVPRERLTWQDVNGQLRQVWVKE